MRTSDAPPSVTYWTNALQASISADAAFRNTQLGAAD